MTHASFPSGFDPAPAISELRDCASGSLWSCRLRHDDGRRHPRLPVEVSRVAAAGLGAEAPLQEGTHPRTMR